MDSVATTATPAACRRSRCRQISPVPMQTLASTSPRSGAGPPAPRSPSSTSSARASPRRVPLASCRRSRRRASSALEPSAGWSCRVHPRRCGRWCASSGWSPVSCWRSRHPRPACSRPTGARIGHACRKAAFAACSTGWCRQSVRAGRAIASAPGSNEDRTAAPRSTSATGAWKRCRSASTARSSGGSSGPATPTSRQRCCAGSWCVSGRPRGSPRTAWHVRRRRHRHAHRSPRPRTVPPA